MSPPHPWLSEIRERPLLIGTGGGGELYSSAPREIRNKIFSIKLNWTDGHRKQLLRAHHAWRNKIWVCFVFFTKNVCVVWVHKFLTLLSMGFPSLRQAHNYILYRFSAVSKVNYHLFLRAPDHLKIQTKGEYLIKNIRCRILHAKLASAVAMALFNLYRLCVGVLKQRNKERNKERKK